MRLFRLSPSVAGVALLAVALASSTARADEAAPAPSPELSPEEVVEIVVDALRTNDRAEDDAGIETVWRFASPGNRASTGPLPRFTRMIKRGFPDMLEHESSRFDEMQVADDKALQAVWLMAPSGERDRLRLPARTPERGRVRRHVDDRIGAAARARNAERHPDLSGARPARPDFRPDIRPEGRRRMPLRAIVTVIVSRYRPMKPRALTLLLVSVLTLAACAERSPDDIDGVGSDAEDGIGEPDTNVTPGGGDELPDAGPDAGPVLVPDASTGGDGGGGDDPVIDPDTSSPDDNDGEAGDDTEAERDPPFTPDGETPDIVDNVGGDDPLFDPSPDADPEGLDDDVTSAPAFPGRPDVARLHRAMTLVLGNTLLDLNRRLGEGSGLTDQQENCLGAFEPGFGPTLGEPPLAIDCDRALATEPFAVYVTRAAFSRTDACLAGLAAGRATDCVLVAGEMNARRYWAQGPGDIRPQPVYGSDVVVRHEIDAGLFEIVEGEARGPDFRCAYDIATGSTLPTGRSDCESLLRAAADHMDFLIAGAENPVPARDAPQAADDASSRSR